MESSKTSLERLQREVRVLRYALIAMAGLAGAAALTGMRAPAEPLPEILTVKGLIVEDEAGRARIVMGAPIPFTEERVRTDRDRVLAEWSERYGGNMDWYFEGLNHDVFGILVMDENGHDRIAIGSPVNDPNIGRRVEPGHGIVWNDAEGFERGGLSYFDERGISGLGLDNHHGEGVYLMATDSGTNGMMVNDAAARQRLFVGSANDENGLAPEGEAVIGLSVTDGERWWVLAPGEGLSERPASPPR